MAALGVASGVGGLAESALGPRPDYQDAWWVVPLLDSWEYTDAPRLVDALQQLDIHDAGLFVALGGVVAHVNEIVVEQEGVSLYETLAEEGAGFVLEQSPGDSLDLVIAGGRRIGPQRVPDAIRLPETVRLESHDVFASIPLRAGAPTTVAWTPTAEPDDTMVVGVEGENGGMVLHLDDDAGAAELSGPIAEADIDLGPLPTFFLTRNHFAEVQLPEGRVRLTASTQVNLYPDFVGPFDVVPRVLDPGKVQAVDVRWWDRTLDPEDLALSIAGLEVQEVAVDPTGHVARAVVAVPADATPGPRAVTLASGGEQLTAPEGVYVAADLPGAGDCESALDEGLVPDGTWRGDLFGLPDSGYDTASCLGFDYVGGDQAIPLRLEAGQTLHARLVEEVLGAALYIVRGCEDEEPPLACFGTIGFGQRQALDYVSPVTEDVLVVVDIGHFPERSIPYVVDIRREGARGVVVEPDLGTGGADLEVVVTATGGGEIEDVAVDRAEVVDLVLAGPVAFATLELPEVERPTALAAEVVVDGEVVRQEGAVRVRPVLSVSACADAPVIGPGAYEGTTAGGADEFSVLDTCPLVHDGVESWRRVELGAGETLLATVEPVAEDDDPVLLLLADCGGAELLCADYLAEGTPEFVRWTAPAAPTTVWLGVDAHEGWEVGYRLDVEILPPGEL